MSVQYLLDGYNIIHQMPDLAGRELLAGREGLVRLIEVTQPQGSLKNRVTIVFDGQADVTSLPGASVVRVVFTRGTSADEEIKRRLDDADNARDVIVVTNDREIQTFARRSGAGVMTVQTFIGKCARKAGPGGRTSSAKSKAASDGRKVSHVQARKINAELEKIWLQKQTKTKGQDKPPV